MQLDKIGRFVKVLFDNFSYNSSQQNLVAFWAVLKNITFSVETAVTTFWVTFGNLGYSFIPTSGHTACSNLCLLQTHFDDKITQKNSAF